MHTSHKRLRQKEQLQQQAGVQLDLKEDDGEQRDVDQPESIVTDLLGLASQIHNSPAIVPTASIQRDRTPAPMGICTKIFCVLKKSISSPQRLATRQ